MKTEDFLPAERLRPFVKAYKIIGSEHGMINRVVPNTSFTLAFRLSGHVSYVHENGNTALPATTLSGLRKSARLIEYGSDSSTLIVIFIGLAFFSANTYAQAGVTPSPSKNIKMKQFSLLVRVPENYGTEMAKAVNPEWDQLLGQWKAAEVYVLSFAFPGESFTVSGKDKLVKKEVILSGNLKVVSNIVLQAETIEQAMELAKSCPILPYGGTVEVREIPGGVRQ